MRKHLLEYDDVMNKQRETIYSIRRSMLEGRDQKEYVMGLADDLASDLIEHILPAKRASRPVEHRPIRRAKSCVNLALI